MALVGGGPKRAYDMTRAATGLTVLQAVATERSG